MVIIKYFDDFEGKFYDLTGNTGAYIQYDEVSGWTGGGGYKSYVAIVSQTGTTAPTATVLFNNLDSEIYWDYSAVGEYNLISPSANFVEDKLIVFISIGADNKAFYTHKYQDTETLLITTSTGENNEMDRVSVEVRVYN